MIEGALIALVSVIVGRFLPGRRKTKVSKAICGCSHSIGYHEGKTGACNFTEHKHLGYKNGQSVYGEVRCTCQHYDGPLPVEQWFATPMLPPGES